MSPLLLDMGPFSVSACYVSISFGRRLRPSALWSLLVFRRCGGSQPQVSLVFSLHSVTHKLPTEPRAIFALPPIQTSTLLLWIFTEALVTEIISLNPEEVSYLGTVNKPCGTSLLSHLYRAGLCFGFTLFSPTQLKGFLDSLGAPKAPPFSLPLASPKVPYSQFPPYL